MGHGESYGMSEIGGGASNYYNIPAGGAGQQYGYGGGAGGPNGDFDPYSSAAHAMGGAAVALGGPGAGAAGIGAAGLNRSKSQTTPYPAFTGPQQPPPPPPSDNPFAVPNHSMYDQGARYRHGGGLSGGNAGLLEAAGLSAAGGGLNRGPSSGQNGSSSATLNRTKSSGTSRTLGSSQDHSSNGGDSYNSQYKPPPSYNGNVPPPTKGTPLAPPAARPISAATDDDEDPYGGLAYDHSDHGHVQGHDEALPNPFSPERAEDMIHQHPNAAYEDEGHRMSFRDDEDYGYGGGRRVLKVANE
ncbi:hypothetical protein C8Q75DRAFT_488460 [Abortiporus biennis]|nr:hypothetical protein C8Q75DRAFT_488460 [Abortiporus biennis]